MVKTRIGGIIQRERLARIGVMSIPDRPGVAAAILQALGRQRINVQFIVQLIDPNQMDHIVFCVDESDLTAAREVVEQIVGEIGAQQVSHDADVALVAIFGPDFRERPNIAGTFFDALAQARINILAISTSISTLSCLIDADRLQEAIAAVCDAFELP